MNAVHLNVGLDMGNALAPWVLCLVLDPLVGYANRIPGVIATKAYMDDTNTTGVSPKRFQQVQAMWETLTSMGFENAKHTCVKMEHGN